MKQSERTVINIPECLSRPTWWGLNKCQV